MLQDYIEKMPLRASKKIELFNSLRRVYWKLRYKNDKLSDLLSTQTYVPSNSYYGHEHWLKNYSKFEHNIYALIEHGMYFGKNESKVGFRSEWDIGSIITYGDYRAELLHRLYPDYNIVKIGPRIHYAPTDECYLSELKGKIDLSKKTMTVFPSHSLAEERSKYNLGQFYSEILTIALELKIGNILISLHPSDLIHNIDKLFTEKGMIVVSSGVNNIKFLPRQRAIFEVSDVTYSNSLGTHVGYSLCMNTPHIINTASKQLCAETDSLSGAFFKEEQLFSTVFNGKDPFVITQEQRELYDYYWGANSIMSADKLYKELSDCYDIFMNRK